MEIIRPPKVRRDGRRAYHALTDGHVRRLLDPAVQLQRHQDVPAPDFPQPDLTG